MFLMATGEFSLVWLDILTFPIVSPGQKLKENLRVGHRQQKITL